MPRSALLRRALTVPAVTLGFVLAAALLPVTLPLAFVFDVLRGAARTRPSLRLVAFLTSLLFTETVGLAQLFVVWVRCLGRRDALERTTWPVQRRFVAMHLFFARTIYRLRFELDGDELARTGPLLVLIRHASIVDTLIPGAFLANRHRLELRYVLKKELLVDPCLDIAGHWLPNHFVSRDGVDSTKEIEAVRALKRDLAPNQGVLLYPEGTRFSPTKRQRTLERLKDDPAALERAGRLAHLLPIRPGGALALLDAAPACDVLFVGHAGLEGFSSFRDIWSGQLVGRTISVRFWREPAASIPATTAERIAWLQQHWERLDTWLANTAPRRAA
ncbi:MAG: 1-acyl-sn-glycerol-3-phosphate acyltransferase [Myxococcaceae bacterium]|nr:1-acyl-sn-glycerol-3-phosphate acyltransferase [Myxococcaceae bacterium]